MRFGKFLNTRTTVVFQITIQNQIHLRSVNMKKLMVLVIAIGVAFGQVIFAQEKPAEKMEKKAEQMEKKDEKKASKKKMKSVKKAKKEEKKEEKKEAPKQ